MTLATLLALLHTALAAGAVGAFMPPLVAAVVRAHWPRQAKTAVALGTSLLVGTGTAWLAGQLVGLSWPVAVVAALSASQASYVMWWKKSGIAPWIEQVILPGKRTIDGEVVSGSVTTAPVAGN